jgi:hypothetical protein
MFYAPFVEKSRGFMEFSAVRDAKAEVIQPDPIGAKTIIGESLTRVPWASDTQYQIPVCQHKPGGSSTATLKLSKLV